MIEKWQEIGPTFNILMFVLIGVAVGALLIITVGPANTALIGLSFALFCLIIIMCYVLRYDWGHSWLYR